MIDISTFTGNFGDMANQVMGDSSGYELYLMGYESAIDKGAFNSGYWAANNKAKFIADFLTNECEMEKAA